MTQGLLARKTGLEPATLGVTGRYSNQLSYFRATNCGVPTGIRTPVIAVKGRCPRPLDDGDVDTAWAVSAATSNWWRYAGSNRRPLACHASALPAELYPRKIRGTAGTGQNYTDVFSGLQSFFEESRITLASR